MAKLTISKSKYLAGMQCPKLLWTHYNARDKIPPVGAATQAVFDQGHKVGDLAKQCYPGGIEVAWDTHLSATVKQSKDLLARRVPVFEASFFGGGVYARADILNPVGGGKWDIIEVKSSTSVKDVHIPDLAVQRYCYESAGVAIRRCYLMHIDSSYVLKGAADPSGLFACEDVSEQVAAALLEVPSTVEDMLKTIAKRTCPEVDIGPQCATPYQCPLTDICWKTVHARRNNIFTLYRLRSEKAWSLYQQGIVDNSEIDEAIELSNVQQLQIEAERSGATHFDAAGVKSFLRELKYPLQFLDFESFQTAVPVVQGTRPYQQIPFQFSLHTVTGPRGKPQHHGWIWDGQGSPFEAMLVELRRCLGNAGSVVAYNASFETARLRDAAMACPKHGKWVDSVTKQMVDLLAPFRGFHVYHPDQHGSASIKAVLPALTGAGYSGLAISDGGMAGAAYLAAMYGDMSPDERQKTMRNLEEYCGLDTLGMWKLVKALGRL